MGWLSGSILSLGNLAIKSLLTAMKWHEICQVQLCLFAHTFYISMFFLLVCCILSTFECLIIYLHHSNSGIKQYFIGQNMSCCFNDLFSSMTYLNGLTDHIKGRCDYRMPPKWTISRRS